ncbi:elongation of very long chain fatty acids protein [Venturia canescens]|uniref:elongation of very long chain fatty acids protein n=1 Tax=Venturia canescens TaxID=32260 RepID=UPI001C9C6CCB|nr:elongation of very long chain fatty acids protein [Venturia canescens]XP_043289110.1 elongation of very long chain fatty acids protein [Venturia canescens]XP_043289111.1 elongation of very long chain fatty acids protein [Venturia canescens]XP_043289112.1 elongation of very long chain fatty acids protein [Venturia canescens]
MTNLIKLVVSNWNEILDAERDPIVDQWPLMSSPGPVIAILAVYLTFVLKIGPQYMEKKPPFELKKTLVWYNAIQVLFSIWLTILALKTQFYKHVLMGTCSSGNASVQSGLSTAAWWYFFAKIIELLDTIFFVLRKKQNQVSFLHVYHHTVTALYSWAYLKFLPGEQGLLVGFLNSLVHIFMYTYYMIAAMGPQYKKYLWWKKYMTIIQLIQFGLMLAYLMMILAMDCSMPKILTYFFTMNVTIFLYLFSNFYRKAYKKKKII